MGAHSSTAFGPLPARGTEFATAISGESREHYVAVFAKLSKVTTDKIPMQEIHVERLLRQLDRPIRRRLDNQLRAAAGIDPETTFTRCRRAPARRAWLLHGNGFTFDLNDGLAIHV